jgi:membrane protein DedA with SNARE-associated domain
MSQWAQDAVATGGYPMLALLVLLENLFPPIPSEVILPLAGFQVFAGTLSFVPAVVAATAGSVVGALALYALGRVGGRPLLLRYGRILRLDRERLDRADRWFDRHGQKIVFLGRMIPGVRSLVSVPAGLSEMPVPRFVALTAAGSGLWNVALIGAGWALGQSWREVSGAVQRFDLLLIPAAALVAVGWFALRVHRRRRKRATSQR